MTVDVSPLRKAITRLEFALARSLREPADEEVRDSVIQRFEFTYDLSHKMLRRVLEYSAANPADVDQMSFPALIRTGWEQGFVKSSWPEWQGFRDMRNITSHTYDEAKAIAVVRRVPEFLDEVSHLCAQLERAAER